MRRPIIGLAALAITLGGLVAIQLTTDPCDDDPPAAAGDRGSQAVYRTYQDNEGLILRVIEHELGDRFAGVWLTRGSWDVNIGFVGDMRDLSDHLPAKDQLTYVYHERSESLATLRARATAEGKRVDIPTGELCPAEDYKPTPSDL